MDCKRLFAAVLAGCIMLTAAGCSSEKVGELGSQIANEIKADGRGHGESHEGTQDETLTSEFFSYKINSAKLYSTLEDYLPNDPDNAFLVVNVTITNVFDGDASIPMSCYDFQLNWPSLGSDLIDVETGVGLKDELPTEWTQFKGKVKEGSLVFLVPNDEEEFGLVYKEIWDDDFEGNTYTIRFTPDRSEFVPLTEDELAQISGGGSSGEQSFTATGSAPLTNRFFRFNVNSAQLLPEWGDYVPSSDSDAILVVNVTVTDVFDMDGEQLPMYSTDFVARWAAGEDGYTFPQEKVEDSQLPDEWMMSLDESTTGNLVFVVPKDQASYSLEYVEFFDNDTTGDTYTIALAPTGM